MENLNDKKRHLLKYTTLKPDIKITLLGKVKDSVIYEAGWVAANKDYQQG